MAWRHRAETPATWGEAIDVPENTWEPPPLRADSTSLPGAKTSTQLPVLEKEERALQGSADRRLAENENLSRAGQRIAPR